MHTPRQLPVVTTGSDDSAAVESRRQFCAHACQAASLVALGALLPACGGGSNPTSPSPVNSGNTALAVLSGTVSGNTVSVAVTAAGPLGTVNGAALVTANVQPGSFLAYRAGTDTFIVMTAICTHQGCTVEQFNGSQFVCPCHGSRYTTSGQVANGPAALPLRNYGATFANGTLTFNV